MAKPITDTLRMLQGGAFNSQCGDTLAQIVKALEYRVNSTAAIKSQIARRKREDASLLNQLIRLLVARGMSDLVDEARDLAAQAGHEVSES